MPNKYSHRAVLANYSAKGLITLPNDQYLAYVDAAFCSQEVSGSKTSSFPQSRQPQESLRAIEPSSIPLDLPADSVTNDDPYPEWHNMSDDGIQSIPIAHAVKEVKSKSPTGSVKSAHQLTTVALPDFNPSDQTPKIRSANTVNQIDTPLQQSLASPSMVKSETSSSTRLPLPFLNSALPAQVCGDAVVPVVQTVPPFRNSSLQATEHQRPRKSTTSRTIDGDNTHQTKDRDKPEAAIKFRKKKSSRHSSPLAKSDIDPQNILSTVPRTWSVDLTSTKASLDSPRTLLAREILDRKLTNSTYGPGITSVASPDQSVPGDVEFDGFSDVDETNFIRMLTIRKRKPSKNGPQERETRHPLASQMYPIGGLDSDDDPSVEGSELNELPPPNRVNLALVNSSWSSKRKTFRKKPSNSSANIGLPLVVRASRRKDQPPLGLNDIQPSMPVLPETDSELFPTVLSPSLIEDLFGSIGEHTNFHSALTRNDTNADLLYSPEIVSYSRKPASVPADSTDDAVYPPDIVKYRIAPVDEQSSGFRTKGRSTISDSGTTGSRIGFWNKFRVSRFRRRG